MDTERNIALLHGIYVSGKNRISMPELKRAFEDTGFSDVIRQSVR